MLNLLDDSFSNKFPSYNSFLLSHNENSFSFPLDESPIKKNKNLFITKKTMKEKIEHQKMKLGKKNNNKEIFLNKKEDLKRRNRESAQNSRNKKKLELIKLIEENKKLKDKIYIINSKINLLCTHCKNFFENDEQEKNMRLNCSSSENNNNIELDNYILNTHNTQSSSFFSNLKIQKLFNFTLITLFTLLCIFCLFSNNYSDNSIRNTLEKVNTTEANNISLINEDSFNNKNEIYEEKNNEKEFFNSFQCEKKSIASMMLDEINTLKLNSGNDINIDNDQKGKKKENKIKNPIYFKLFVQSCSLDEEPENNNNKDYNIFNDNKHYVFSTDKSTYQEYYFFCRETDL